MQLVDVQDSTTDLFSLQLGAGVEHNVLDLALDVLCPGGKPRHGVVVLDLDKEKKQSSFIYSHVAIQTQFGSFKIMK